MGPPHVRVKRACEPGKSNARAIGSCVASQRQCRGGPHTLGRGLRSAPPPLLTHRAADVEPRPPPPSKKGADRRGRPSHRPWRSRAQSQERLARPPARLAHRLHGALRVGQVLARLRHDLRRGPAPLRRVALLLRPAVPRPDGQAGRRLHRGPLPRGLHRPEVDLAQPALDGRHHHRGLRLPPAALRPHRQAALPRVRPPDRPPVAAGHRRQGARAAGGQPLPGALAAGARAQGRVRRPLLRPPDQGLQPGAGRRARRSSSPSRRS